MFQNVALNLGSVEVYSQKYLDSIMSWVNSPIYRIYHPDSIGKEIKHKSSAASFVSVVLFESGLIFHTHAHIRILLDEMKLCGWHEDRRFSIEGLLFGDIILWEQNPCSKHRHIGIAGPDNMAVSFYSKKGYPILHELGFEDLWRGRKRKIISRFTLAK